MNNLTYTKQKGIGLIEVLIAAVIFALGSIAIIQLQGKFFKSSGAAHAHSIAMTIAEEKLEDLRGFETISDPDADVFDFVAIVNDAGGQCDTLDDNACVLTIPSGSVTIDNTVFNRTWTVTNYYYNAGTLTTTAPAAPNNNIVQKDVTVTVTWTDADGSNQSLSANTIINSKNGVSSAQIVSNTGGSGEKPEVPYTPSTEDRVTPISVGTNSKRETLVPSSETVDGYTRTQFTAYTYNSSNVLVREEEFKNVACTCRIKPADGIITNAAAYPEWNGIDDTYQDTEGEQFTDKVRGCVPSGPSNCSSNPEPFCEICCRDHHDKTGVTRKYDPFRSLEDYTSYGDHKHYNSSGVEVSDINGNGTYLESCRMKRVDGYWRVYQDWNLVNLEALPLADLSNTTTKSEYASYVNAIIDEHIDEEKVSGETLSSPPSQPAAINHNSVTNYVNMTVGTPTEISSRAIYLDYMDSTHLTNVKAKKSASQDYLLHIPFYEVEVAQVTEWGSDNTSVVNVNTTDMDALSTNTNAVTVTANLRKSNSGLTATTNPIDVGANTNADDVELVDSMTVCVGCTAPPPSSCTNPTGGADIPHGDTIDLALNSTENWPNTCSYETRSCNNGTLSGSYTQASCSENPPSVCTNPVDGTDIAHGVTLTFALNATEAYPATCSYESRTCTNGSLSGTYTEASCTVTGVPAGSCTDPAGGVPLGDSEQRTYFENPTEAYPNVCTSELRTCSSGILDGSFTNASCSASPAQDCTNPAGGADITHGTEVEFFQNSSVTSPSVCVSEMRACDNGALSGSYTASSCNVVVPTCSVAVSGSTQGSGVTPSNVHTVSDGTTTKVCPASKVTGNFVYSCPSLVVPQSGATITVTSRGTTDADRIIAEPYCGSQTVNFP